MESSYMDSLFGFATTAVMVEKEPPPAEPEPFKIPMKIAERVMNNCYYGDGTVHLGDHLLFLHELCELFKCAGISMDQVRKKLFSISLRGKAAEWYKLLKNGRSYLLAFYLFAISNTPENPFASICSETFIETARQNLLLLVGFDTLIYRKYCDTPPILVGHQTRVALIIRMFGYMAPRLATTTSGCS